jgi:hypothetical protein
MQCHDRWLSLSESGAVTGAVSTRERPKIDPFLRRCGFLPSDEIDEDVARLEDFECYLRSETILTPTQIDETMATTRRMMVEVRLHARR